MGTRKLSVSAAGPAGCLRTARPLPACFSAETTSGLIWRTRLPEFRLSPGLSLVCWGSGQDRRPSSQSKSFLDFPGGPVVKMPPYASLGSIPGEGTRFHMLQLRAHMSQLKDPHAVTKPQHSQIK